MSEGGDSDLSNPTFNKRLTLLKLAPGTGRTAPTISARVTVWADVSEASITAKTAALQVNQYVELTAYVHRRVFDGHTHAEYRGVRYKIAQTGSAGNDLFIKLQLERE